MPITIGGLWLDRGTQNNTEPARLNERNEKEVKKEGVEGALLDQRKHG